MFRYVVEYTENPWHDTDYSNVFADFEDCALMLRGLVWHLSAKCHRGTLAIKTITLQEKTESGKWADKH